MLFTNKNMPIDDLILDETRRQQLDKNIRSMVEQGASETDVRAYASDFTMKFGTKKKATTTASSPQGGGTNPSVPSSQPTLPKNTGASSGSGGKTSQPLDGEGEYPGFKPSKTQQTTPSGTSYGGNIYGHIYKNTPLKPNVGSNGLFQTEKTPFDKQPDIFTQQPVQKTPEQQEAERKKYAEDLTLKIRGDVQKVMANNPNLQAYGDVLARGLYESYLADSSLDKKQYESMVEGAANRGKLEEMAASLAVPTALGMIGAKSSMESVSQAAEGKLADIMYKGIDAQSKELTTNLSKLRDAGAEAAYNKKADLYSQLVSKRQKIDVLGNQIKATQLSPQEMQAYEKFSAQAQQIGGQLQQMKQQYDEMTKQAEQIQQSNLDNVTKQARLNQISGSYRQIEQKYNEGVKAYNDLQAQMQPIIEKQKQLLAKGNPNNVDLGGSYQKAVDEYNALYKQFEAIPQKQIDEYVSTMKEYGNLNKLANDSKKFFPATAKAYEEMQKREKEWGEKSTIEQIGLQAWNIAGGLLKGTINNLIVQPILSLVRIADFDNKYTMLDAFTDAASNMAQATLQSIVPTSQFQTRKEDQSYNWKSIPESIGNMGGFMAAYSLAGGSTNLSKMFTTKEGIRGFATGFLMTKNSYYEEGKQAGLTDAEANSYSTMAAGLTSMLEGIEPNNGITSKLFSRNPKYWVDLAKKGGSEFKTALAKELIEIGKEVGGENIQELSQLIGDKSVQSLFNENKNFNTDINMSEVLETIGMTTLLTGSIGGISGVPKVMKFKDNPQWLTYMAQNYDKFKDEADRQVARGEMSREDYEGLRKNMDYARTLYNGIPEELRNKQGLTERMILSDAYEQYKKVSEDETINDVFRKDAKEKMKGIEKRMAELDKATENVQPETPTADITNQEFTTPTEQANAEQQQENKAENIEEKPLEEQKTEPTQKSFKERVKERITKPSEQPQSVQEGETEPQFNKSGFEGVTKDLVSFAEKNGLSIKKLSTSNTDYGESHYYELSDNEGNTKKVRISDHSVENADRLTNESHFSTQGKGAAEFNKKSADNLENYFFPDRFEAKDTYVNKKIEIPEKDLKTSDKIISERTSDKGNKIYLVERPEKSGTELIKKQPLKKGESNAIKNRKIESSVQGEREGTRGQLQSEGDNRNVAPQEQESSNQTSGSRGVLPTEESQKEVVKTFPSKLNVVEVKPYTEVYHNTYKPNEQLKFNQGTYEAVRVIAHPDVIKAISIGSKMAKMDGNTKVSEQDRNFASDVAKKLGYVTNNGEGSAILLNKGVKELAKQNRTNTHEVFMVLGDKTAKPTPQSEVEATAKALDGVDSKKIGVIDYNAKRLSLEEREKEDKPIIKDNTPLGTLAKNDMGDAYELQLVSLNDLTPKETGQNLDLVEK